MHIPHRFSRSAAAALVVAALFLIPLVVNAADTQTLAGTWVVWAELTVPPGVQVQVPALHTYHSDGTITSSDVLSLGGLPGNSIRITPMHGVWERTGPSAFATTNLFLVYDASSSLLIGFGRARATLSFARNDPDQASRNRQSRVLALPVAVCLSGPAGCGRRLGTIPRLSAQPSSYGHPSSLSAGAAVLGNTPRRRQPDPIADCRQHAPLGPPTYKLSPAGMMRTRPIVIVHQQERIRQSGWMWTRITRDPRNPRFLRRRDPQRPMSPADRVAGAVQGQRCPHAPPCRGVRQSPGEITTTTPRGRSTASESASRLTARPKLKVFRGGSR